MGGKSKKATVGYWYLPMYHAGLCKGPFDAFLEFRGGDKPAWQGRLTQNGTITINAPNLWGGEKDQGGIVGDVDVMFGEADQQRNPYMLATLGNQVSAWRGFGTLVFKGGKFGAMNPFPQKPSYKFQKILKGWDGECWYPEKAIIDMSYGQLGLEIGESSDGWSYKIVANGSPDDYSAEAYDHSAWLVGASPFASGSSHPYVADAGFPNAPGTVWSLNTTLWARRVFNLGKPIDLAVTIFVDNYATVWVNGVLVLPRVGTTSAPGVEAFLHTFTVPASALRAGNNVIALKAEDFGSFSYAAFRLVSTATSILAMNPAHVLYFSRTNSDMGREPIANIDDASLRAAADTLYDEGFGICTERNPASESVVDFERRICKLIGGSFVRDLVDGRWHLDLARDDYVLEDLPILTDDDILEFKELPSTLDNAVNSVSCRYFDPNTKENVVTPPVQARALVMSFGTIHQTNDYPEVPTGELGVRVAQRDLTTTATPTKAFELITTRKPYAWRPNNYFRLQSRKHGIPDLVCIVGEKQSGTLKSGAIRLKAAQHIYTMPEAGIVGVEPGVDTGAPQTPVQIALQRAFEAPYIDVVAALSRADLAALPDDVGFVHGVASDPARSRDYTMRVATAAGTYAEVANGDWCPTAIVVEAAGFTGSPFTVTDGKLLDQVVVGMPVLWDDEIGRVDAINAAAGTIQIGRGCADTVSQRHAAGARLWFWSENAATDLTEYTASETINVKLLTNTGSQQLPEASAVAMPVTFQQRQARPYPPARLRINGTAAPDYVSGADVQLAWVPRNRVTQADQLIDAEAGSIAAEAGTSYRANFYGETGLLSRAITAIAGTSQAWSTELADSLLYAAAAPVESFETFATAIPGGYGTLRTSATAGTATHDASTGAVLLTSSTTAQTYYQLTSRPAMVDLDLEVDMEIVEDYDPLTNRHAGLWLTAASGSPAGMRIAHHQTQAERWYATRFGTTFSNQLNLSIPALVKPTFNIGQRRRLRVVWAGDTGLFRFYVNDALVLDFVDSTYKALDAGVFFFNNKVRVHEVLLRGTTATARRNNKVRMTLDSIVGSLASLQKHDRTVTRVGYGYSYGSMYGGT